MDNITCKKAGEMRGGKWESNIESARRVYDPAGLSPTCPTCGGGNQEVKIIEQPKVKIKNATKQGYLEAEPGDGIDISTRQNTHRGTVQKGMAQTIKTQCEVGVVEPIIYDDYNGRIKADQTCIGTLTTNCGNDAERNGVKIIEKVSKNRGRRRHSDSPDRIDGMFAPGWSKEQIEKHIEENGLPFEPKNYRIRKLTPKECFRLMGVKDDDFERVAKNQSDSSLYHLAGDSLVTTVMMAILSEMLETNWQDSFNNEEWFE